MASTERRTAAESNAAQPRGTVLRVHSLTKSFHRGLPPCRRTIKVLMGADLEVRAGELVGLVGENGSGKSSGSVGSQLLRSPFTSSSGERSGKLARPRTRAGSLRSVLA